MRDETKSLFARALGAFNEREERAAAKRSRGELMNPQREAAVPRAPMDSEELGDSYSAEKAAAAREVVARIAAARAAAERAAAAAPQTGIVSTCSLRVRKNHNTSSAVVGILVDGNQVTILGTWSDGKDTWAKLEHGWAAMVYNGETYIKIA